MDTNKMKLDKQETNTETGKWKSADFRKNIVKKIIDTLIKHGGNSWQHDLSELTRHVERFEERVNSCAKNQVEYTAIIKARVKALCSPPQSAESKLVPSNSSGSEAGKAGNEEWKEEVYQKVQRMKNTYFALLSAYYQRISSTLQQHESSPQEPKRFDLGGLRHNKKIFESIFAVLRVSKSEITTEIKEQVDKTERTIHSLVHHHKNAYSHHRGKDSADVQSKQQFVPSQSKISPTEILGTKPSPQVLRTQNYHLTKQISQQNNLCLQEQQVAKQYSNSQQDVNQLSVITGPGKAVQQQTHHAQQAAEAFGVSVNTLGTSASPLSKDCNDRNEISHKPTLISEEPSAAMQHLIKVLSSMSPEALSTSVGEIRKVVYLNDVISMPKSIERQPKMAQQQKQPSFIPQDGDTPTQSVIASDVDAYSQARSVTCNDFVPTERKMSCSVDAISFDTSRVCASTHDNFNQMIDAEEPDLNSVTSKVKRPRIAENCDIFNEIKEINRRLIDSEVVIGEKENIESAAGRNAEHGEGLVVKVLFNAVSVNQNLFPRYDKKSIIKPLWLLVPTSYPSSSPVILDKMPLEVSEDLEGLSVKAKAKLGSSLRRLDQPLSLRDIAKTWDHCARETIREYALTIGGGTFSSIYGGWEMC